MAVLTKVHDANITKRPSVGVMSFVRCKESLIRLALEQVRTCNVTRTPPLVPPTHLLRLVAQICSVVPCLTLSVRLTNVVRRVIEFIEVYVGEKK